MVEAIAQQDVIHFAVLAHRFEIHCGEARLPIREKLLEPATPRGGQYGRVGAIEAGAVGGEALYGGPHLAHGVVEIRWLGLKGAYRGRPKHCGEHVEKKSRQSFLHGPFLLAVG